MSDPDPNDEQSISEAIDEDELGEDLADFPPDHRWGLEREDPPREPEEAPPVDEPITGLLVPDDDLDDEVAVLGDPEAYPSAEEAAIHEIEDP